MKLQQVGWSAGNLRQALDPKFVDTRRHARRGAGYSHFRAFTRKEKASPCFAITFPLSPRNVMVINIAKSTVSRKKSQIVLR
jgi:hypothetical protein